MCFKNFRSALAFAFIAFSVCQTGVAQDGAGIEAIVPFANDPSGWKSFAVMTRGDSLSGLTLGTSYFPGATMSSGTFEWAPDDARVHSDWDGLGAYRTSGNKLRVLVNHEVSEKSTITSIDLNIDNLRIWVNQASGETYTGGGQVVTGIGNGFSTIDTATGGSGLSISSAPLSKLCSGTVYLADSFGINRGFSKDLYLTGEETFDSNGRFFALDFETGTLYEAPDLGGGSWENAALIDTGETDIVALLLSEDGGLNKAPLRLYVGVKGDVDNDGTVDFLEANGLKKGTVYYWVSAAANPDGTTSTGGVFSGMSNGDTVAGAWSDSPENAALFFKAEDVHTNPANGTEVALAAQGEGVFAIDLSMLDFIKVATNGCTKGALGNSRAGSIRVLFNARENAVELTHMDNLVWSDDGLIYINEDGGILNSVHDSFHDIFSLDPTDGNAQLLLDGQGSSTSGITDISDLVGFGAGSIFLSNSFNGAETNGRNSSLHLLVSPTAILLGDIDRNGVVDFLDISPFTAVLSSGGFQSEADCNQDGVVNFFDITAFIALLKAS